MSMKAITILLVLVLMGFFPIFSGCQGPHDGAGDNLNSNIVKTGLEVFLESRLDLVEGKRVGLITNPTGLTRDFRPIPGLFSGEPRMNLVALYGPEHGVRGNAQAGEYVPFIMDEVLGLPVFSLYGQSLRPPPGMFKDIDAFMRNFDTSDEGKLPEEGMIEDVDVLVFDIQDVGTRIYTYIATMAYAMQAAAENGLEFIVLDRPNPLNGSVMEGPVLDYPAYSSFVGLYPVPVRHGMTAGELALLFNGEFFYKKTKLTVVPMKGWRRGMAYDNTGLPWVMPSPNMPTLDTATVYPGQVFLEGTNVSEGRGTTRPFELFGAPWIDGRILADALNGLGLPGVNFREAWFTPTFSKFQGELCGGAQIHVMDRETFRPFAATLHILRVLLDLHPDRFHFHEEYFDKIMGTSRVRKDLEAGRTAEEILIGFESEIADFSVLRRPYLLYDE